MPLFAILLACAPEPVDARRAWLVEALNEDNRVWLGREPTLLETKYARMAADPYDFMRGTAGVFVRDLARPGTDRAVMSFGVDPAATEILLVGDPHPENLSTFLPGEGPGPVWPEAGSLWLEVADMDGASYGPWTLDVRRATLGLAVMLDGAGCDLTCRGVALTAWADGYADEVATPAYSSGLDGPVGGILSRVRDEASEEGAKRERLDAFTSIAGEGRRFRLDSAVIDGDGVLALTPEEQAQLDRLLDAYRGFDGRPVRVLDGARRFGVGVSSLPAVRYLVAWDRGGDGPEDDEMLELREVVDPTLPVGLVEPVGWLYDDPAARIVETSQTLWSFPEIDVRLDAMRDGAMTFKVRTWSSWSQSIDHEEVAEEARRDELAELADQLGRHLAAVHRRTPTRDGGNGAGIIVTDLAGREADFALEVVGVAERDLARNRLDHALFLEALEIYGPRLGAP